MIKNGLIYIMEMMAHGLNLTKIPIMIGDEKRKEVFDRWIDLCKWIINHNGDYYIKWKVNNIYFYILQHPIQFPSFNCFFLKNKVTRLLGVDHYSFEKQLKLPLISRPNGRIFYFITWRKTWIIWKKMRIS